MARRNPVTSGTLEREPVEYKHHSGRFPTTAWELVAEAKDQQHTGHFLAVNSLTSKYWKPAFYFVRVRGYSREQAEDLVQEFFLQFLERDWIRRVDPQRGRFRTFMLTILVRFLADQGKTRVRRQKRFEQEVLPVSQLLTEAERTFQPPTDESPESVFLKRWALELVNRVRESVRSECVAEERETWYELFEASVVPDAGKRNSQPALAQMFGLSRDQVRYRLEQVRRRFDRSFRTELRCDGCPQDDVEKEARELMDML